MLDPWLQQSTGLIRQKLTRKPSASRQQSVSSNDNG